MIELKPTSEPQRLQALASLQLEGEVVPSFQALAQLAARLGGAPLGFVNLITADEMCPLAAFGFPGEPVARPLSFCTLSIYLDSPLVVEDAARHPSFSQNPFVLDGLVGAYAGVPVRVQGHPVGTVCVVDRGPRPFGPDVVSSLEALAQQVEALFECRRAGLVCQADRVAAQELLGTLGHEVRTPLMSMQALLHELRAQPDEPEALDALERATEDLSGLVEDVLALSSAQAGRLTAAPRSIDLCGFLQAQLRQYRPAALEKGLGLRLELAPELPSCVRVDDRRLRQILANLLSNSLKFTHQGGIALRAAYLQGTLTLEVEDTGLGIPVERQARVFERWERGPEGTTGLGLHIVATLVELLDGRIELESESGQGTLFRVSVPAPRACMGARRSWRVLVVEDAPVARMAAERFLERLGHCVRGVGDAESALDLLRFERFDAVLLDVGLPGMDGLELARTLRERPGAPVIIGMSGQEDVQAQRDAGMAATLVKPVRIEQLDEMLRGVLGE